MTRNLILSGGIFHPFETTSGLVAEALSEAGVTSEIVEVGAGLQRLAEGECFEMLTFNCLSWSMTQHEKYEPYRADFARKTSAEERAAIERHVTEGGGLLGMHTAAICFDDWPGWGALLGVHWVWGQSGHPPPGPMQVRPETEDHPMVRDLPAFRVEDELYGGMDLAPDAQVLARATVEEEETAQPVLVARAPAGRVVFDALGHDARSFEAPEHRELLRRAAHWLLDTEGEESR